jgi:hypothetical protein
MPLKGFGKVKHSGFCGKMKDRVKVMKVLLAKE